MPLRRRRKTPARTAKNLLLSVIVPAFRKEKTIFKDLLQIRDVLHQIAYPFELICTVDGQEIDKTWERAKKAAQKDKRIKIVGYKRNHGKGHAVRYGMARSHGDIIAFIDAGMDINPSGLILALEHMRWYDADIIVGSKRHPASKVLYYPWQRRLLSWGYQMIVRFLFGVKVRDTQAGLKFFRRKVLERVLPRLLNKAFAFDIEILAVSHHLGFRRIYEAPIEYKLELTASTIATKGFLKTAFWMLWDTLAVFYRLRIRNYYSDKNKRRWRYDPDLNFKVSVG